MVIFVASCLDPRRRCGARSTLVRHGHTVATPDLRRREAGRGVGARVDVDRLFTEQRGSRRSRLYRSARVVAVRVLAHGARVADTGKGGVARTHVTLFQVRGAEAARGHVLARVCTTHGALRVGSARVPRRRTRVRPLKGVFIRRVHFSTSGICFLREKQLKSWLRASGFLSPDASRAARP